nr:DUF255 domain-containing protein [Streptomyces boluensis]
MEDGPTPNRLAQETSPYLLQHADNPVDLWPWEPAAFPGQRVNAVPAPAVRGGSWHGAALRATPGDAPTSCSPCSATAPSPPASTRAAPAPLVTRAGLTSPRRRTGPAARRPTAARRGGQRRRRPGVARSR